MCVCICACVVCVRVWCVYVCACVCVHAHALLGLVQVPVCAVPLVNRRRSHGAWMLCGRQGPRWTGNIVVRNHWWTHRFERPIRGVPPVGGGRQYMGVSLVDGSGRAPCSIYAQIYRLKTQCNNQVFLKHPLLNPGGGAAWLQSRAHASPWQQSTLLPCRPNTH